MLPAFSDYFYQHPFVMFDVHSVYILVMAFGGFNSCGSVSIFYGGFVSMPRLGLLSKAQCQTALQG
jgi:hypothetical protein